MTRSNAKVTVYELEILPVSTLRKLAPGMMYRWESRKSEVIDWLITNQDALGLRSTLNGLITH